MTYTDDEIKRITLDTAAEPGGVTLDNNGLVADNPNCIWTYTGRMVNPLDPDPATLVVEDWAHALANQCRFTGHTRAFYSVAQHSLHVAALVAAGRGTAREQLYGLLHDATEAYLSDIARPIKHYNAFGDLYREVEDGLMKAIAWKHDLPVEMPEIVKAADHMALVLEMRDLCHPELEKMYRNEALYRLHPKRLIPSSPMIAEMNFKQQYEHLVRSAAGLSAPVG